MDTVGSKINVEINNIPSFKSKKATKYFEIYKPKIQNSFTLANIIQNHNKEKMNKDNDLDLQLKKNISFDNNSIISNISNNNSIINHNPNSNSLNIFSNNINKILSINSLSFLNNNLTSEQRPKDKFIEDINKIINDLNNRPEIKKELIHIKSYFSKGGSSTCYICDSQKYPGKLFILKNIENGNGSSFSKPINPINFQNQIKNEFHIQKICRSRYVTSVNGIFQIDSKFLIFSEFELNGDLNQFRKK